MQCPTCGYENRVAAKFCEECATPLARTCTNCAGQLSANSKFCPECGHPTGAGDSRTNLASPQNYTPKHLAERILSSKSALEGERKQVTVLFADLKGSMELLADRDPEEARKLLDPILERMMEGVHRYEGTVNQVMGDGIMALFGAPLAHEDHAVRACYAALRMQETVKRYADEACQTGGVPLYIRVGVNSGEVVVRSIGSDLHMDYTAVGQTTHVAARLEQMAIPASILIAAETYKLVEDYVLVKPTGAQLIKGLKAPLEVFELIGARAVRSRLHAAIARGLTQFVGRELELGQLNQALEIARGGQGQVVAVVGEPGVGKSRLFWEFTHTVAMRGWRVVESRSIAYGTATPFLPLRELLRDYFKIEPGDDALKIRAKVSGSLLLLDRALEPSMSALLWLLDVPVGDAQWERLDPQQRRQQTLDAIKRVFLRESQAQPLMLVFEDLHWLDAETQALLNALVESLPSAQLLLLVNYRPEYRHSWGSKTYYRQVRVDPLTTNSADELLRTLLGNDLSVQPLAKMLVARTEGNPFFLEESVRMLVETKVLAGEPGVYRAASVSQTLQIPATAQAMLAARIDRLAPGDKRLIQTASVIGKDVPLALLLAIADEPEESVRASLANLQTSEFLYEARLFPDIEYTFKHALTHDVAYESLLHERRRGLHARILEVIETNAERTAEDIEQLAYHALRGESWEKALTYCQDAGTKAADRSAHRAALGYFEQALAVLERLPTNRDMVERSIDLRLDVRTSLVALGEGAPVLEHLRRAEPLAEALGDDRRRSKVAYAIAHASWLTGDHDSALSSGQRALELAADLADPSPRIMATLVLGQARYSVGEYEEAIVWQGKALDLLKGDVQHHYTGHSVIITRRWLVQALVELGAFDEAMKIGEEGTQIARRLEHPYSLVSMLTGVALCHTRQGAFDRAIPMLEESLELSRNLNFHRFVLIVEALLGPCYAHIGRIGEALAITERSQRQSPLAASHMGETLLLTSQPGKARESTMRALGLARQRKERGHEAWALHLLGEIGFHEGMDLSSVQSHYRESLALAEQLGMRPVVAHCRIGLGKCYLRNGSTVTAHEHLTVATNSYREMNMQFWLNKGVAEARAP